MRPNPAGSQGALFLKIVELVDEGIEVTPPVGVVYSTHPRRCLASDGGTYFVKGPELNIVVPEVICHLLAAHVGLRVAEFALARRNGHDGLLFASKEVPRAFRAVDQWLQSGAITNPTLVRCLHVFDVLVANRDRNIGNLIGESVVRAKPARVELVAIDFEKAEAFRGDYPLTTVPTIEPNKFRPSGILGQFVRANLDVKSCLEEMQKLTRTAVLTAFGKLEAAIERPITWKENSLQLIEARVREIRERFAEVW